MRLRINGQYYEIDIAPEDTLLHVLRDHLNLFSTVKVCGNGECGACLVLVNNRQVQKACKISVGSLIGDRIRTIEGIPDGHPVKSAWKAEDVQPCTYCKSGQILRAIALLARMLNPSPADIKEALNTDECTCGENPKIIKAVNRASKYSYDS